MMMGSVQYHASFPSQYVQPRHVEVWLPTDYANKPGQQYAVLYMHDGQNLFNGETAYAGVTWGIPEAMSQLHASAEIRPTIVVGVWNTTNRWVEYLPQRPFSTPNGQQRLQEIIQEYATQSQTNPGKTPLSDNYLRFLIHELKPFIDDTYRTLPDRENTFIMGSSMGGLISLYALCEYPRIFAGAGCVSTHWPATDGVMCNYLQRTLPMPGTHKIYFDYGTATLDAEYEPYQQQVDALMENRGYTAGSDWLTRKFPGAEHSESSWRERVHIPLAFLLRSKFSEDKP